MDQKPAEKQDAPEQEQEQKQAALQPEEQPGGPVARAAESAEVDQFKRLFKEYGQPVMIGLGIAIAVFLVFTAFRNYKRASVERASELLMGAQSMDQLQQVVNQYRSTPYAPIAQLGIASAYYDSGQYEAARGAFEQFRRDFPTHPMASSAEFGVAQCQEALGQLEQAMAAYQVFSAAHTNHYLLPLAAMGQARCLELQGRYAEAKAVYEDFIAAHPESPWVPQAESSMLFLEMTRRAQARAPRAADYQMERTSPSNITVHVPAGAGASGAPIAIPLPEPAAVKPAAAPAEEARPETPASP